MGAISDFSAWMKASRTKPQLVPSTTPIITRGSQDGALYVQSIVPTKHVLVDEGSYFVTTNPTPSTPIAYCP